MLAGPTYYYEVYPNRISDWKMRLLERMCGLFEEGWQRGRPEGETQPSQL